LGLSDAQRREASFIKGQALVGVLDDNAKVIKHCSPSVVGVTPEDHRMAASIESLCRASTATLRPSGRGLLKQPGHGHRMSPSTNSYRKHKLATIDALYTQASALCLGGRMDTVITRRAAVLGAASLSTLGTYASEAIAQLTPAASRNQIQAIEARNGGRLGVTAIDTGTGAAIEYRADERFPLTSLV
jgi:hypothetical protein